MLKNRVEWNVLFNLFGWKNWNKIDITDCIFFLLQTILLNIASAFLSFVDHFKLYSSFCASHSKAQKLLHPVEGNQALQVFLAARNPKQQHSNTLESYLIKPIQRILKYPLLLQQIRNLCDTNAEEYRLVSGKIRNTGINWFILVKFEKTKPLIKTRS